MASGRFRSRIRAVLTSAAILLPALAVSVSTPTIASASSSRLVPSSGTTTFSVSGEAGTSAGIQSPEFPGVARPDAAAPSATAPSGGATVNRSDSSAKPGDGGESDGDGNDNPIAASNPELKTSFQGLNHFINRFGVNHGNQFSLEPPDQGLCAGNGKVFETLNDVLAVYNPDGSVAAGPISQNEFYNYPPAINRNGTGTAHNIRGPFVTDPSCLFDSATQRWFHVVLTLEVVPKTGAFTGKNHLDLAVSTSSNPSGSYTIYRLPVQDDGTDGTPNHGCTVTDNNNNVVGPGPCLGDYPHIGADGKGFYITTNEYSFFGNDFHGAQIYAFSKQILAAGAASVAVTQIDTHGLDNGNSGFTLAPAQAPPGGAQATARHGTEYFLSSNAADEAHGNGVAVGPRNSNEVLVWALTNTSSLNGSPDLELSHTAVRVGRYNFPPASTQKVGPTPLRDCLNDLACSTAINGGPGPVVEKEYALDSSDTRMLQTTFARGSLWGALDTGVGRGSSTRAGIEWFVIKPSISDDGNLEAEDAETGFLSLPQDNLSYPAIGVTAGGRGVMAFTVVGPNHFPSAGYALITRDEGTGKVHVAQEGAGPADGFTGYVAEVGNPPRPRWGDYGAAAVVGNSVWIASEYIGQSCDLATFEATGFRCGNTRTLFANWDTRISLITP